MAAGMSAGDLRSLAGDIRGKLGTEPGVVVLIAESDGAVPFVVAVNPAAQDVGVRADDLVKRIAAAVGGRGVERRIWRRVGQQTGRHRCGTDLGARRDGPELTACWQ